jgi:glycosyltransferase involved in cell wall biosynthesis
VPAHNEVDNIDVCLEGLTKVADRLFADHEIIVVDDGSTDGTGARVEARASLDARVRLVRHDRNGGYGQALRTGFASARMQLVFVTDADNQFDLEELEDLLAAVDDGADMAAGYRVDRQEGVGRRAGALAWNVIVRGLFRVPIRDVDCAFKLFRRDLLDGVELVATGAMVSTELVVELARRGAGFVEIGVTHLPRTAGTSSGGSPKVVARAFLELARLYPRLR